MIINKENINSVTEYFKNKTTAAIFGKGPSFKQIKKKNDNELFVCINTSINYIDGCDILVANDFESYTNVKPEKLKDLKTGKTLPVIA